MAIKSGPTPKPAPKQQTRVGFVNLVPNQRPGDTFQVLRPKKPRS